MTNHVKFRSGSIGSLPIANSCGPAKQSAEDGYLDRLDDLMSDAVDHRRLDTLANALAWTIARIAIGCGPAATGDVFRRIGGHMCTLETLRQTEAEAQRALQEGRLPS